MVDEPFEVVGLDLRTDAADIAAVAARRCWIRCRTTPII
jgi:hypothetical protein